MALGTLAVPVTVTCQEANPAGLYEKAVKDFQEADYRRALAAFERLIQDESRSEYHFNVGVCQFLLGNYPASHAAFDKAVRGDPRSADFRLGLAKALFRLDRKSESRTEFARVLEQQPRSAEALYHLGLVALAERDYTSALEYFERVIQLDPMHAGALFNAGRALIRLQDPDRGRAYLARHEQTVKRLARLTRMKKSVESGTSTSSQWMTLGNAYLEAGLQTEALEAFQEARQMGHEPLSPTAIGSDPAQTQHPGPMQNIPAGSEESLRTAKAHRKAGRLPEAAEDFRQAWLADPEKAEPLLALAEVLIAMEEWQAALEAARSLTRHFPALARGHYYRASCLARLGRPRASRRWVKKALQLEPTLEAGRELLDQLNRHLEKQQEHPG